MDTRLRSVPLFRERSRSAQVIIGLLVPLLFGAVAGVFLGISAAAYWTIGLVALIGGVLAGVEHDGGWEGADRGLVGGTLYGIGLLVAHAIAGTDAEVSLPGFAPVLVVFTAVIGMFAGALGGRLRRGAMERGRAAAAPRPG
jgi:hypothetical protein